jgi:arsenite methyltransferase
LNKKSLPICKVKHVLGKEDLTKRFGVSRQGGAINLIPDKKSALMEMLRVLKPGGRLIMADQVASVSIQKDIKARLASWFQ